MLFGLIFIFGIVLGLMLIAYDDGKPFALFNKIRCKMGKHKTKIKVGSHRINKYYCQNCKAPRKSPDLKVIHGGNKMGDNGHKF